jgi:hypothetical protein
MNDSLLKFHENILSTVGIPKWMNIKCPFCLKELPLRSIRSVALKLNTRNMGDVVIEVFCIYCNRMDMVYFKSEAETMNDFISLLSGNREPKSKPIIEEEMYKMCYNNVMDKKIIMSVAEEED